MKPVTVILPGFPHAECLAPFLQWLVWGLRALGYGVDLCEGYHSRMGDRAIWLGAHVVRPPSHFEGVIYNTEVRGSGWVNAEYKSVLHGRIVWDYAGQFGRRVPLGYCPALESVPRSTPTPNRVVHYGSENLRRIEHLAHWTEALRNFTGDQDDIIKCAPAGTYGFLLNTFLTNAACVLNIHYYPNAPVEQARVGFCMANGIAVISEESYDSGYFPGPLYVGEPGPWAREALSRVLTDPVRVGREQRQTFLDCLPGTLDVLYSAARGAFGLP